MKYRFVQRIVSFPVYEVEAECLGDALNQLQLGELNSVKEPVNEENMVRCERVVDGKPVTLTPEEVALMEDSGYEDAVMTGE